MNLVRMKDVLCLKRPFCIMRGGLWQSAIFGGMMVWFILGFMLRFDDHTYIW